MRRRWSPLARISVGCLLLFCLAMALAMQAYPGGSWLHPHAYGHSFFENFWCDLLREPAYNGAPNGRSVRLATLGFAAMAGALGPFWWEVARLLPARRGAFVRGAGLVSAFGTAAVALLPSDRFPGAHGPAVLSAGGLGFVCGCLVSAWALSHFGQARWFAASSLVLVAAAGLNLVLYVYVAYLAGHDTVVLPAAQKVATLALLVWLVSGLAAAEAPPPSAGRPTP
jgi:hypothetical protein